MFLFCFFGVIIVYSLKLNFDQWISNNFIIIYGPNNDLRWHKFLYTWRKVGNKDMICLVYKACNKRRPTEQRSLKRKERKGERESKEIYKRIIGSLSST